MSDQYRISGSGATAAEADKDFSDRREGLVGKLKDAKASTTINSSRHLFTAAYELIKPDSEEVLTNFEVRSSVHWEDLINKAQSKVDKLSDYKAKFTVSAFYDLSESQLKAARGNAPSPAGYSSANHGEEEIKRFAKLL